MTNLAGARVAVAGAGAIGSATALALARRGADVLLIDPAALGDNASGIAAGMLAPALEAATDEAATGHFPLLRAARDEWPGFAEALGQDVAIDRTGALWLGSPDGASQILADLHAVGATAEIVTAAHAAALSPHLQTADGGVFTTEDWRIDPQSWLTAMRRAFLGLGGQIARARVADAEPGLVRLGDGAVWASDLLVVASGHPSALTGRLAPELAVLAPIKGQILRFQAGSVPAAGPVIRTDHIYVIPSEAGPAAGATMEAGLDDRHRDPAVAARLRASAASLFPDLTAGQAEHLAGVRSATPDALPLVGASAKPGVLLATGARRNGWLLAPMIARMICAQAVGEDPGPWAIALAPGRFSSR